MSIIRPLRSATKTASVTLAEQLFGQMQPSGAPVDFAPEPVQFKLQPLGRCLSAVDR
jgi:hypothetical protein